MSAITHSACSMSKEIKCSISKQAVCSSDSI